MRKLEDLLKTPRMFYEPLSDNNSVEGLMAMCNEVLTFDMFVVEIGSFAGVSADLFARYCNTVLCIDVWHQVGVAGFTREQLMDAFKLFKKVFACHSNMMYYEEFSVFASQSFDDDSVDMVYIDAVHDFEYVQADISAWFPKVKVGGYLCGHDIHMEGVKKAVEQRFGTEYKTYKDTSWLIRKI